MAYVIKADECLGCGTRAGNCPAEAISETPDGKFAIDPEKCVECGTCAAVCPIQLPTEG